MSIPPLMPSPAKISTTAGCPTRRQHASKSGLTVLLFEQNANSALAVADYGVLLSLGKVVANLPAAELKADASLRAAYLGY